MKEMFSSLLEKIMFWKRKREFVTRDSEWEYKYIVVWDAGAGKNNLQVLASLFDEGWEPVREVACGTSGWAGWLCTLRRQRES